MATGGRRALRIVAMGDSTTAGTPGFLSPVESPPDGAGDKESQYAYWLMKEHDDWQVLNKGVNGQRSDQILSRFDRDVIGERPRITVILAGVNDIYQGFPMDFSARNLVKMYSKAVGANIVPVACTVLPYNTLGGRQSEARRELNSWIVAESERLGILFCDTAKATSNPTDPDKLTGSPDELHPDVGGYRMMASAISRTIEGYLSSSQDRPLFG